jgi:hypothetical protein
MGVSTFQDASGLYYSDNSNTSSDNICRVIVNAINSEEPARFVSAEKVTQSNQDCYRQAVPFVEGDVIQLGYDTRATRPAQFNRRSRLWVEPITCL